MVVPEAVSVVEFPVYEVSLNKVHVFVTHTAAPAQRAGFLRALRPDVSLLNKAERFNQHATP